MQHDFVVYLHRSQRDGRVYVGTTNNPVRRWRPSKYRGSPAFFDAIISEGWDNFSHEIVSSRLTRPEAETVEKALIVALKSTDPAYGFNKKR